MGRADESGAYVGGISTMLAQSDTCASCGQVHPGRRFGLLGPKGECPRVVFGSIPVLTGMIEQDDLLPIPAFGEPRARARPAVVEPPLPVPVVARKGSALTVPWPMPSHLEDYL